MPIGNISKKFLFITIYLHNRGKIEKLRLCDDADGEVIIHALEEMKRYKSLHQSNVFSTSEFGDLDQYCCERKSL